MVSKLLLLVVFISATIYAQLDPTYPIEIRKDDSTGVHYYTQNYKIQSEKNILKFLKTYDVCSANIRNYQECSQNDTKAVGNALLFGISGRGTFSNSKKTNFRMTREYFEAAIDDYNRYIKDMEAYFQMLHDSTMHKDTISK